MNFFDDLAERDVLQAILHNSSECEWCLNNLKPEHFYNPKCRNLYERIMSLLRDGKNISVVTIIENYNKDRDFIMDLFSNAYTTANSKSSSEIVLNQYYKREAYAKLMEAHKHATSIECTTDSLRERLEDIAYFLSHRSNNRTLMSLDEIAKETLDNFDAIAKSDSAGISTGFRRADELGWTFRPGTFNVIGARPSMGKSALALDIAQKCGVPTAFYSLEMKGIEQFERLLSKKMGVANAELRSPSFIKKYSEEIVKVSTSIAQNHNIFINDSPTISPMQLRMQVKRAIARSGVQLVIVDYMGYISGSKEDKEGGRRIEMSKYSRAMKEMSKDLGIATIGLCQLNRECESRENKRPIMSDLRETGDIEQDAHMIWFLYRDAVYNDEASQNCAELICRKVRGGEVGMIKLDWNGKLTRFSNWEDDQQSFDANDWTSKY